MLAGIFSSPDDPSITMSGWAKADPADVVATAAGELAGTTTSATYGAPYNHASEGQSVLGLQLQKWGGVRRAGRLRRSRPPAAARRDRRSRAPAWRWPRGTPCPRRRSRPPAATAYADALAKAPDGDPAQVPAGHYGPVPALTAAFLRLAQWGGLEGSLTSSGHLLRR